MGLTSARVARHPIHPMLVVLPIGLWVAALVFDIVYAIGGDESMRIVAFWNIALGVIGALLAAIPGFVDWLGLTGRAARLGTYHMLLNLGAVVLFAINWFVHTRVGAHSPWPLVLSIVGVVGIAISGWLGGHLVYVHRVGVEEEPDVRAAARQRRVA